MYVTNDQFTNALSFANSTTSDNLDDIDMYMTNTVAVRACLRACVLACVCVCVRACERGARVCVCTVVRARVRVCARMCVRVLRETKTNCCS